jgi:hypothetical protein
MTCLAAALSPAEAQPVIRFGVRVLQASDPSTTDPRSPLPPPPPAAPPPAPFRPTMPPPPGQSPSGTLAPPLPQTEGDERFNRLLPQLRMLFRYSNYTTLEKHRVEGPVGVMQRFSVAGDRSLEVTPDQMQGKYVRMHVRLLKGDQPEVNASLLAAPGAPAVFGGPPYGNGVLIIILWANPTGGPGWVPARPFWPRPRE